MNASSNTPMTIDLNADLGEGCGADEALLELVSSANIACGWHAGSARAMHECVRLAVEKGVSIGAHPGFHDPEHFGRRELALPAADIYAGVLYQLGALAAIVRAQGARNLRGARDDAQGTRDAQSATCARDAADVQGAANTQGVRDAWSATGAQNATDVQGAANTQGVRDAWSATGAQNATDVQGAENTRDARNTQGVRNAPDSARGMPNARSAQRATHAQDRQGAHNTQNGPDTQDGAPDAQGARSAQNGPNAQDAQRAQRTHSAAHTPRIAHVKPHGALYNQAARDVTVARAIVAAVRDFDASIAVFALAGSVLAGVARAAGLVVIEEVFADRGYRADGSLVPRDQPGALLDDEDHVLARTLDMIRTQRMQAVDGQWVPLRAQTICLHGDGPHAVAFARRIRAALDGAGIGVRAVGK